MNTAIEFKNISKNYGEKSVINNLNLKIEKGEFVTIIGSSGCGKTTIIKMINGLIEPSSGEVFINGESLKKKNLIELRRNTGYVIQGNVLFPHMSVEQNISYVPALLNKKDKARTKAAVEKCMHIVGLDENLKEKYPAELSGGQQQRVGIARALAVSPDILLMDEPFGSVDEITRTQLQNELKQIHTKTNITILFVTHDISEAIKLGTKVMVVDNGNIIQYNSPEELLDNPSTPFVRKLIGSNHFSK